MQEQLRADGKAIAGQIQAAGDDDIKDTRWENIKVAVAGAWRAVDAFVDRHIDVIKKIGNHRHYGTVAYEIDLRARSRTCHVELVCDGATRGAAEPGRDAAGQPPSGRGGEGGRPSGCRHAREPNSSNVQAGTAS